MSPTHCKRDTNQCLICTHHRRDHRHLDAPDVKHCTHPTCACDTFVAKPCKRPIMHGRTACELHGGKSLRGLAHPRWNGKDLTKVLPEGMRNDYVAALNDPELLSLRRQIGLTEARIIDLLRRLESHDGQLPVRAAKAWADLKVATNMPDTPAGRMRRRLAFDAVDKAVSTEVTLAEAWKELRQERDLLRKLKDSENDVLLKEQYVISIERALAMTVAMQQIFVKALEQHVISPTERIAVRTTVAAEYPRLVSGRGGPPHGAGAAALELALDPEAGD